ncbi:MAG TPA: hypothetical protein VMS56_00335 [Thermoanaerobaculia bacterium]|nr:hypothetical protein [Thermoanaerobaculia bacterium]
MHRYESWSGNSAPRSALVLAFVLALVAPAASAADPERTEILRRIGEAVAADANLTLGEVRIESTAAVVAADEREWEERIRGALSVVYAPPGQRPFRFDYATLRDMMPVEMGGGRTPERVVDDVVAEGRIVASVVWTLGDQEHGAFAVFDGQTLLFDTMLSMPVIQEPVFTVPHL